MALQQQNQYQCQHTQQEHKCILLYAAALQCADRIAASIGAPSQEVEEAVHYVAVPPGDRSRDAAEDDPVRHELINLVNVEAVVCRCPQSTETTGQSICHRLFFLGVDECSQCDGNYCHHNACSCYAPVQMDFVSMSVGGNEFTERNESAYNGHQCQEYQREGHR